MAAAVLLAACAPGGPGSGGGAASPAMPSAPPVGGYAALERDVLAELDAARTDPSRYASRVEAMIPHFDGLVLRRPGTSVGISTREGAAAVREAAAALRATQPMGGVARSPGMTAAARGLVQDHGPRGAAGHTGSDGSTLAQRLERHGRWLERITESISYGPATGADVIQGLIIDDGVRDRGHRRNLLDRTVRIGGIACGPHARYGTMCVIDLAGGYRES